MKQAVRVERVVDTAGAIVERIGLVNRKVLPTQPIGVEYTITDLGCSLRDPFAAFYNWSLANGSALENAQGAYDESRRSEGLE